MPSPFEPPPGDPERLGRSAGRLGETAGSLGTLAESFDRGAALTALAVMRSESAPRIDEMTDGLRGMKAEIDRLRSCGEQVADVVRQVAGRQQALEGHLADLAVEADHRDPATGASTDLEDSADDARRAFTVAEGQAAAEIDRLTGQLGGGPDLADVVGIERVELDQSAGRFPALRAWAGVDGAFEAIAEVEHRTNQATASYQVLGAIAGFYEAGEVTAGALAHPVGSAIGFLDLGAGAVRDPTGTARLLWHGFRDPYVEDWRAGDRGRAVGRGLEYALELAVGAKGLAGSTRPRPVEGHLPSGPRRASKPFPDPLPWPVVTDLKLQNYVHALYKGTRNPRHVGSGTTMDAIRREWRRDLPRPAACISPRAASPPADSLDGWLETRQPVNMTDWWLPAFCLIFRTPSRRKNECPNRRLHGGGRPHASRTDASAGGALGRPTR
jgi:hypothetical protein